MRALSLGLIAIFSLAIFTMCTHESLAPDNTSKNKDIPCDPDSVYFVNTIKPLIVSGCAIGGCHDEKTAEHRVILTTYTKISDYVKEGDADKSELYEVLFKSGEDRMPPPPHDAFTDAEKALVKDWINQGAHNNICTETSCDTVDNISYSLQIVPIINGACKGCHSESSAANSGGDIRLDNHAEISKQVQNGKLYKSVAWLDGAVKMPDLATEQISTCKIRTIKLWMDQGAPNN